MITKITGTLVSLRDAEATVAAGPFEYQVLVPEFVRRQLQSLLNEKISLRTITYLDGNPQKGRLSPRMVGFMTEAEKEFFDLVCSVDGVGVKKALRAMVRPVQEVATYIEEADVKQLTTLPGIGPAVADRVIAKLRRKMPKFALIVAKDFAGDEPERADILTEVFEALVSLGHSNADARKKIEAVVDQGKKLKTLEEFLTEIYRLGVE